MFKDIWRVLRRATDEIGQIVWNHIELSVPFLRERRARRFREALEKFAGQETIAPGTMVEELIHGE